MGAAEDKSLQTLKEERSLFLEFVLEFMAASGVRVTALPPKLVERATHFGRRMLDAGVELAKDKTTIRPTEKPPGESSDRIAVEGWTKEVTPVRRYKRRPRSNARKHQKPRVAQKKRRQ